MKQEERPLEWIGSSHKDLMQLPADVRKSVGFALHFAQHGEQHPASKVLKGFGGAGVLEVVENDVGGTYRPFIRSGSRKRCSCSIASRRRAKAALPRRRRTWTLFGRGSRWPRL